MHLCVRVCIYCVPMERASGTCTALRRGLRVASPTSALLAEMHGHVSIAISGGSRRTAAAPRAAASPAPPPARRRAAAPLVAARWRWVCAAAARRRATLAIHQPPPQRVAQLAQAREARHLDAYGCSLDTYGYSLG